MSTIAPSPPLSGSRLAVVIAGGLIGLFATLVLMAGAGVYWVDGKKDADGYFTTHSERFVTTTYAIASDDLDVSGVPLASDHFGKVRLQFSDRGGKPVFAGIARTRDVDAYLAGAAHETLTDVDFSPFRPQYVTSQRRAPAWSAGRAGHLGRLRNRHRHADAALEGAGRLVVGGADERRRIARRRRRRERGRAPPVPGRSRPLAVDRRGRTAGARGSAGRRRPAPWHS